MKKVLLLCLFTLLIVEIMVSCADGEEKIICKNDMVTLTLKLTPSDMLFYTSTTNCGGTGFTTDSSASFTTASTLIINCPKNLNLVSAINSYSEYIHIVFDPWGVDESFYNINMFFASTESLIYSTSSDFSTSSTDYKALIVNEDMEVWLNFSQ